MILAAFWTGLLGAIAFVVITRRHRKHTVVTPIADAPDATPVHVRGKVVGDMPLRAPFTRRACVYYWVDIHVAHVANLKKRKRWRSEDGRPFTIEDDTGTATVPLGQLLVPHDVMHIDRASRLAPRILATLKGLGVEPPDSAEVTIFEASIGEGDIVEVLGAGMRRISAPGGDAHERGFRDRPVGVLELGGDVEVLGERRPVRTLE